jgi:flagellar biosynthetic protein FliR
MEELILRAQQFFLVMIRVSSILFFLPLWDSRLIPAQIRLYSILVISLALTPAVAAFLPPFPGNWPGLASLVLREMLIGLSLCLVVRFVFSGVQMAGELLGVQMGFGMVTLIDPQSNAQTSVIADILLLTAMVLFLAVDGHHLLLVVLAQSFSQVPVGGPPLMPGALYSYLVPLSSLMFQLAIKLVAPIMLVLFLSQIALGLVSRTVPQVQVMIVGLPLTIGVGLIFLSITLMLIGPHLIDKFAWFNGPLHQVLRFWRG